MSGYHGNVSEELTLVPFCTCFGLTKTVIFVMIWGRYVAIQIIGRMSVNAMDFNTPDELVARVLKDGITITLDMPGQEMVWHAIGMLDAEERAMLVAMALVDEDRRQLSVGSFDATAMAVSQLNDWHVALSKRLLASIHHRFAKEISGTQRIYVLPGFLVAIPLGWMDQHQVLLALVRMLRREAFAG